MHDFRLVSKEHQRRIQFAPQQHTAHGVTVQRRSAVFRPLGIKQHQTRITLKHIATELL